MVKENSVIMAMARDSLRGRWGLAVGAFVVYAIAIVVIQIIPILGIVLSFLIGGPLALGLAIFCLAFSRNQDARIEQLFQGFRWFWTSFAAYLLMGLFTVLWMLLLIVPGIIASISYAMTFFIMADNPNIAPLEAISLSKKMMYGYKWKYFCLLWRFFGWFLLTILTCGIGMLWLGPYVYVSISKFYDDINGSLEAAEAQPTDNIWNQPGPAQL
jgi:uncharacterized membrane protein